MTDGSALRCVECGELLLRSITDDEVETLSGHRLVFRRHTDYVLCPKSATAYRVTDLRAGNVVPISEADLVTSDNHEGPERRGS